MSIPTITRAEHYEGALRRIEWITMHTSNDHDALVSALNLISKVADDAVLGPVKTPDGACICGPQRDDGHAFGHLNACPQSIWMQAAKASDAHHCIKGCRV